MKRAWIALGVLCAVLGCSLWAVGAVRSQAAANARDANARRAKKAPEQQSATPTRQGVELASNKHLWAGDEGRTRLVAAEVPVDEYSDEYRGHYGPYRPEEYGELPEPKSDAIDGPRPWWRSESEFGEGEYSPYSDGYYGSELPNEESREFGQETPEVPAEPMAPSLNEYPADEAPIEEAPLEVAPVEVSPEDMYYEELPAPVENAPVQEAAPVEVPAEIPADMPAEEPAIDATEEEMTETLPAPVEPAPSESDSAAAEWLDQSGYFLTLGELARLDVAQSQRDDLAGWHGHESEEPAYLEPNSPYAYEYYILPEDETAAEHHGLPRIGESSEIDYELILADEFLAELHKNVDAEEAIPAIEEGAASLRSEIEPGITTEHCPRICDGPVCPLYDRVPHQPAPAAAELPAGEGVEGYETYESPYSYDETDELSAEDSTELPPVVPQGTAVEESFEAELNYDADAIGYAAGMVLPFHGATADLADLDPFREVIVVEGIDRAMSDDLYRIYPAIALEIERTLTADAYVAMSPCQEEWIKMQLGSYAEVLRTESAAVVYFDLLLQGSEELAKFDWTISLRLVRNVGENRFSLDEMPGELWNGLTAAPEMIEGLTPTQAEIDNFRDWLVANVQTRVQRIETLLHHISGQLRQPSEEPGDEGIWSADRESNDQR